VTLFAIGISVGGCGLVRHGVAYWIEEEGRRGDRVEGESTLQWRTAASTAGVRTTAVASFDRKMVTTVPAR